MRSYLSLIPISAKVHKRRNRMTRICIILSVFMVTAIFSMADLYVEGERNALIEKHGNWHIAVSGISGEEAQQIAGRSDIAAFAWKRVLNYEVENKDYHIDAKNLILYGAEPSYIDDIREYETEGAYPQSDTDVMLSMDAKDGLGVDIGSHVILHTPAGNLDYAVSGFCVDDTEYNAMIDGVCTYMTADGFDRIAAGGG